MNTTSLGQLAETAAAEYLQREGYEILERNYRTPMCEIDIVAKKGDCLYFTEVKYRSQASQGTGLDYITHDKQRRMYRAAQLWVAKRRWQGEMVLSAIEVDR